MERQAQISLTRLRPRIERYFHAEGHAALWYSFEARLETYFERLFAPLLLLYGQQYDFFYHLENILEMTARMWVERTPALKRLDAEREQRIAGNLVRLYGPGYAFADLVTGETLSLETDLIITPYRFVWLVSHGRRLE